MIGSCLCGRVRIETPGKPTYVNICNCNYCRKSGGAVGQFPQDQVRISGETRTYVREDLADTWMTLHFCENCGAATHSTGTPEHPTEIVRVNMRLFEAGELVGTEARYLDGRSVHDENDEFAVIATRHYGDGTVF
jgi:hypothetical protein